MSEGIAQRLREASAGLPDERVSVAGLVDAHGPAANGSLLLLLAVPCLLPIPGTGTVLGFGVIAMAVAMWRGTLDEGLPRRVAELQMSRTWAQRVLATLASIYGMASGVAKARSCRLMPAPGRGWLAALIGTMGVMLIVPIPFGNVLPALALILIGLGLTFRDGLVTLLGAVAAGFTTVVMSTLMVMAAVWGTEWVSRVFA
jgi:hypothetical protein